MKLKKNPKANLEHYSGIFTLLGLVLTLFITYVFIEHKSYAATPRPAIATAITIDETPPTITYRIEKEKPKKIEQPIVEELIEKPKKKVKVTDPNHITKVENNTEIIESLLKDNDTPEETIDTDLTNIESLHDDEELEPETIDYVSVENIPVFPGCEKFTYDKIASKKCFNKKIAKFFNKEFDTSIASELNLTGLQKIDCQFIINANGHISPDIKTRSKHPKLTEEVETILKKLPKMLPAKQNGKPVNLRYTLPFRFRVE